MSAKYESCARLYVRTRECLGSAENRDELVEPGYYSTKSIWSVNRTQSFATFLVQYFINLCNQDGEFLGGLCKKHNYQGATVSLCSGLGQGT